jgi:hypothetical protein
VSQPSTSSIALRAAAWKYLRHAFGERADIPWQLAAKLLSTGLFKLEERHTPIDQAIIRAAAVQLASLSEHEPSVFLFFDPDDSGQPNAFIELSAALGTRSVAVAKAIAPLVTAAVKHYAGLSGISTIVGTYGEAVASEELPRILEASAALADALASDWNWQIAVLSNATLTGLNDIVATQSASLLRWNPTEPEFLNYLESQFNESLAALGEQVDGALDTDTAKQLLTRLGPHVAHLPWRANAGFGAVLGRLSEPGDAKSLWPTIAQWLRHDRPAWWFHVWLAAMTYPTAVPKEMWREIWDKVYDLAALNSGNEQEPTTPSWLFATYTQMLRFFFFRIEAALPAARAEFALWAASKLASDIAGALGNERNAEVDDAIRQASEDAQFVWNIVSPSVNNELREAFLEFQAYWPVAILASITEWRDSAAAQSIPSSVQTRFGVLVRKASVLFCTASCPGGEPTTPLVPRRFSSIPDDWAVVLSDVAEWIAAYHHLTTILSKPDDVTNRFRQPMNHDNVEQIVALARWSKLVKSGEIPIEQALEILTNDEWLASVEPTLSALDVEHIIFGLLGAPWGGRESIRVEIAHWAAKRCSESFTQAERRSIYYIATVLFSIKGGTCSAIVRLKHDDERDALKDERSNLNAKLEEILPASPGWMRGRIGSVLAISVR